MLFVLRMASPSVHQARYLSEPELNTPILLLEDGVYHYPHLKDNHPALYVHNDDALTRGMTIAQNHQCSDKQILELTEQYPHWIEVK